MSHVLPWCSLPQPAETEGSIQDPQHGRHRVDLFTQSHSMDDTVDLLFTQTLSIVDRVDLFIHSADWTLLFTQTQPRRHKMECIFTQTHVHVQCRIHSQLCMYSSE